MEIHKPIMPDFKRLVEREEFSSYEVICQITILVNKVMEMDRKRRIV
jgi:hypothetical protein